MKSVVDVMQPLGRALMLPIAVLPVAGLLLRFGQPDLFNVPFVAAAGDAIFSNLGLLFAIGVAFGLAKENHGAAGLAGAVCFLVATEGAKILIQVPPAALQGFPDAARPLAAAAFRSAALAKLGIPTGIASGLIAGALYNRFHTIRLPDYLAFFGGRRFVPIAAGSVGLILAAVLGAGWSGIAAAMDGFSHAVASAGDWGLFLYGTANRLLIVTGLHHILNNLVWFMLGDFHGVTGDIKRFFAGDPTAGAFMSGYFPVMMFGLPAACLAMYRSVAPARRKEAAGLFLSMALTAFLTGVTEPIEFSFMFLAPALYVVHAVLTGASMALMDLLGVKLGFGFSAGLFDYLVNFGKATKPLMLIPVGLVYGAIYYGIFRFAIVRFDIKTPGREDAPATPVTPLADADSRGAAFVAALGGTENLVSIDACTTRLRLELKDGARIDEAALKALGARGLVRPGPKALQVVLGPIADQVAGEIRDSRASGVVIAASVAADVTSAAAPVAVGTVAATTTLADEPPLAVAEVAAALGGADNIGTAAALGGRVVVTLRDPARADASALDRLVPHGVARLAGCIHLLCGAQSETVADALCTDGRKG